MKYRYFKVKPMTPRISSVLGLALAASFASAQMAHILTTATTGPTSVSNTNVATTNAGSNLGLWKPLTKWALTNIGGTSGNAAISADGMIVGGNAVNPADNKGEISRYSVSTGLWTYLGGAGGYSGTSRSSFWGMSRDGSTLLGFGYGAPQSTGTFTGIRPMSVRNGVITDHSIIQNASSINRLTAASTDGSIVAGRCRETSSTDGSFWWTGATPANPIYLSGTNFLGDPNVMSGDGRYICGQSNSFTSVTIDGKTHTLPYIYDRTTGTTELIPSIAGLNGNAVPTDSSLVSALITGMSEDGNTVVGYFRNQIPNYIDKRWGFIWKRGIGVVTMEQWFADNGLSRDVVVSGNTYSLYPIPKGISPDGQTIIGNEFFFPPSPPTIGRGFMVTPGRGISGAVTLQDIVGVNTDPATWTLYDGSNAVAASGTYGLGTAGQYQIVTNVAAGDYQLAMKGRTHLTKRVPVTLGNNLIDVNFSLINGDVDHDDEVGPGDFGVLSFAFGSVSGDSNWNTYADLDIDGEVGPSDFGILSANFGLSGD